MKDSQGFSEVVASRAQNGALGVGETLAGFALDQCPPVCVPAKGRVRLAKRKEQPCVGGSREGERRFDAAAGAVARVGRLIAPPGLVDPLGIGADATGHRMQGGDIALQAAHGVKRGLAQPSPGEEEVEHVLAAGARDPPAGIDASLHIGVDGKPQRLAVEPPAGWVARPLTFSGAKAGASHGIGGSRFGAAPGHG